MMCILCNDSVLCVIMETIMVVTMLFGIHSIVHFDGMIDFPY